MTRTRRTLAVATTAALGAGLLIAAAPSASAAPARGEREAQGSCSAGSRWNLELETEHGGLKADLDLDTSRAGSTWKLKVKHNGAVAARTSRTTENDGDLDYQKMLPNRAGTDKVVVRAKNPSTGEVCRAVVRL